MSDMAEAYEGGQEAPETDLTMVVDDVLEEESQVEWQLRGEVETLQTELMKRDSPPSLNLPHSDAKPESNQHGCYEEQITDPQSSSA